MAEKTSENVSEHVSADLDARGSSMGVKEEGLRRRAENMSENKQKALNGELYYSFTPELMRERTRCSHACHRFNTAGAVNRRRLIELWRDILGDTTPMPPEYADQTLDEAQFEDEPWIEPPIHIDYGTNVSLGSDVYINFNCVIIDTCQVTIGARTLLGPNVSIFSGTHPIDPAIRNGTLGPEMGKEIHIEEDCWIGGNAVILPGVRIGRGATVGAGSVVAKDVAAFTVVAGNPAKMIRKVVTRMDPHQNIGDTKDESTDAHVGAEVSMAAVADESEKSEAK
ncbi:hypothetical protein MMC26_006357 [Xylographa opegraphella]|nr:hypothetical protein [Xylographa opegraphella]